jgi:hypothetical protein
MNGSNTKRPMLQSDRNGTTVEWSGTCLRPANLLSLSAFRFTHDDHRRKARPINRRMMKKSRTLIGHRPAKKWLWESNWMRGKRSGHSSVVPATMSLHAGTFDAEWFARANLASLRLTLPCQQKFNYLECLLTYYWVLLFQEKIYEFILGCYAHLQTNVAFLPSGFGVIKLNIG